MFLLLSCMLSITKFVLHSIELPYFVLSVVVVVEVVRVVVLWGEQVYSDGDKAMQIKKTINFINGN